MQKYLLFSLLTLMPVGIVAFYALMKNDFFPAEGLGHNKDGFQQVYWEKLKEFNLTTKVAGSSLESLQGQKVMIPGFIVPLDDASQSFTEFLLVPSPTACIHAPPPPSNQMVMVRMKTGEAPTRGPRPVWIKGSFRIQPSESGFGTAHFLLLAEGFEDYKM